MASAVPAAVVNAEVEVEVEVVAVAVAWAVAVAVAVAVASVAAAAAVEPPVTAKVKCHVRLDIAAARAKIAGFAEL